MDCGATLVKYILFVFNLIFVVCGILLIVFGSIILSSMGDFKNFSEAVNTSSVPTFIIVLGCIIFIISFFGCCGAIREDTCLTLTYSALMLVLFILQMIFVVYMWIERQTFVNNMGTVVDKAWEQRNGPDHFMDALQISLDCCGKLNAIDYTTSGEQVPNSCCGPSAKSCSIISAGTKQGCTKAFKSFWENNIIIIQYAGLTIAAVELIAFIFACCIGNQMRNERRRAFY